MQSPLPGLTLGYSPIGLYVGAGFSIIIPSPLGYLITIVVILSGSENT